MKLLGVIFTNLFVFFRFLDDFVLIPAQIAEVIDRALVDDPEVGCKSAASLRKQIVAVLPVETRNYCRNLLPK